MVVIKDKKDCCGCNACVQKCPKQCIVLLEDSEGFSYPRVNMDVCRKYFFRYTLLNLFVLY